jgi:outer membrane protein OmpA-like peptidoglycan-associated protein
MNCIKVLISISLFLILHTIAAQQIDHQIKHGYYCVVGTFAIQDNANKLTNQLLKKGMNASYFFSTETSLYYVYTYFSIHKEFIIDKTLATRYDPNFNDAWVKKYPSDSGKVEYEEIVIEDSTLEENNLQLDKAYIGETTRQIPVLFKVFNSTNSKPLSALIKIIDGETNQLVNTVNGNEVQLLSLKENQFQNIKFICEVFGFRKAELNYNAQDSVNHPFWSVQNRKDTTVISIDLIRHRVGDVVSLFQVYFYNDAAIMKKESVYQLTELLKMLTENPGMKIKLHGHTNGNFYGQIIKPTTSTNFFSITNDVERTMGSAKELSYGRAEIIRNYLILSGVDSSRLALKAWGGKRAIFDKHDVNAMKNLRVDIEICEVNTN